MKFQFGPWELIATPADEGMTFFAPEELLPFYNAQLTSPGQIFVVVNCCGGSSRDFVSPSLLNTGQPIMDPVIIDRIAPNLGPNLYGYYLTHVTQTIDELTITPKPGNRTDRHGAFTVSIYGEPIPPLLGDFNVNGTVDAADFVVWRDRVVDNALMPNGLGTSIYQGRAVPQDYDAWRAHFGETAFGGGSAAATQPIPEPASLMIGSTIVALLWIRLPRTHCANARGCVSQTRHTLRLLCLRDFALSRLS